MKIKGKELSCFIQDGWPKPDEDWYWDHDLFDIPGDDETYDTDDIGGIFYQGNGSDPTDGLGYDLAALIRKWRRERDYDFITIRVPKERSQEIRDSLKEMGLIK